MAKRKVSKSVIEGFFEEVRGYLPRINDGIKAVRVDSNDDSEDPLQEVYRLIHIIKGSAGMIGASTLAHVAHYAEELADTLLQAGNERDDRVLGFLKKQTELFEYLADEPSQTDERAILRQAHALYRRGTNQPESADAEEFLRVVDALKDQDTESPDIDESPDVQADPNNHVARLRPPRLEGDQLAEFVAELEDHVKEIVAGISALDQVENVATLANVLRHAHSLKGSAGSIGFHCVAHLAHEMEHSLLRIMNQSVADPAEIALVLDAANLIEEIATEQVDESTPQRVDGLFRRFESYMQADVESGSLDEFAGIDDSMAEIQAVFAEEAEEHLQQIHSKLPELKEDPENKELQLEVRRVVHTLKGAAGAVGRKEVMNLAHRMEDLLDEVYEGSKSAEVRVVDLLLDSAGTLDDLVSGRNEGIALPELYERYNEFFANPAEQIDNSVIEPVDDVAIIDLRTPTDSLANDSGGRTQVQTQSTRARNSSGQVLRVPLERIDELVRLGSELVINRTAFEQRMAHLLQTVSELKLSINRMERISETLESEYEASTLGGRRASRTRALASASTAATSSRLSVPEMDSEFDELELDQYTQFHLLARSLAETTADITTVGIEFENLTGDFDSLLNRQARLSHDMQDGMMRLRMVPFSTLANRLQRVVRGVAQKQRKQVDLKLVGGHTELDKMVLEEMADPLAHMMRNCVDHAVEPPELRQVQGKLERATIQIKSYYQGTQVVIEVSDDGSGLQEKSIRDTAVERGLLTSTEMAEKSPEDLWEFIFEPGFSTSAEVSEVSGRGVGMEVVRDRIRKLKGTISVSSVAGQGTTFSIRLPMTLAILRALLVQANHEMFAIPLQSVVQILRVDRKMIQRLRSKSVLRVQGTVYPLTRLSDSLNLQRPAEENVENVPVLMVETGGKRTAVMVDRILRGREVVVKSLGSHLRRVRGLIGATLLGDGTVVPILDPSEMLNVPTAIERVGRTQTTSSKASSSTTDAITVMCVDDSVSVRRVTSNLIRNVGWSSLEAKDGLDALEKIQESAELPDLVLLDIEMPRMDGFELLATLRSQQATNELPIVMVTSRSGEKHRRKALELGASGYLVKPFQDSALIALVKSLVKKSNEPQ